MDKAEVQKLSDFWQEASARDFQTATDIFNRTENHVAVLFYIHLTLEKILKALYVTRKAAHAPFSHNLLYLLKETGIDADENDRKLLSEINEFNIEARYPDEKFLIYQKATRDFTQKYIEDTGRLIQWISGILKERQ
jgi:HEPN domain-containing protein